MYGLLCRKCNALAAFVMFCYVGYFRYSARGRVGTDAPATSSEITPLGFVTVTPPRSRGRETWQVSRGALSKCFKLGTNDTGWSRGDSNPGPPPCKGGDPLGATACSVRGRETRRVSRGALSRCNWPPTPKGGGTRKGGAAGMRTPDLRRARAALSRLSYGPLSWSRPAVPVPRGGRAWTRTRDLGLIRAAL